MSIIASAVYFDIRFAAQHIVGSDIRIVVEIAALKKIYSHFVVCSESLAVDSSNGAMGMDSS